MSLIWVLIIISLCISGAAFLVMVPGIALFMVSKAWVLRGKRPTAENIPIAMWLNKTLFNFNWSRIYYVDYFILTSLFNLILFGILVTISVVICYPIPRLISASVLFVIVSLHALRWIFDTSRALKKINSAAHGHEEE